MQNDDIYRELTEIFREFFDDDAIVLTPQTNAADIKDWDSAAHIGLIVSIEERLQVKFKSSELEGLHDIGSLVGVLKSKLE